MDLLLIASIATVIIVSGEFSIWLYMAFIKDWLTMRSAIKKGSAPQGLHLELVNYEFGKRMGTFFRLGVTETLMGLKNAAFPEKTPEQKQTDDLIKRIDTLTSAVQNFEKKRQESKKSEVESKLENLESLISKMGENNAK